MKVGDLVTLSSYGKKIKRTGWVKETDVGIIKKIGAYNTYRILWCNSIYRSSGAKRDYATRGSYWDWRMGFERRDLKFAK